ncbi:MAG: PD40 domain-containing protein [Planctomycetia bacterium]|nr:PD40 domain-containing protein [Planctomycetia bacterium]
MRIVLGLLIGLIWPGLLSAQEKPRPWMDIEDCPAKHPGPWLKIKDTPEQAQLRKELTNAGKIVFASNRDGNWEIYVCNADGSSQKNLTNNAAWDIYPRWTPDGKIIFFSDRDAKVKMARIVNQLMESVAPVGPWHLVRYPSDYRGSVAEERDVMPGCGIYVMDADGSNVKLLVKEARTACLSPDGKWLTFERRGATITRDLATGEEFDGVRRYFGLSRWPEFSPDGKHVLVASMGDTRGQTPGALNLMATIFELKANARPAGPFVNVNTGALTLCPRWRPDGQGIVIVQGSRDTRLQAIDLAEKPNEHGWLDGKTIGLATPADRYIHTFPAYSGDGKHLAFSLSSLHFHVREQVATLGYKPWKDGNQIVWQELCVGRAEPGKDNVWIQLTEGGYANRDADWYRPR